MEDNDDQIGVFDDDGNCKGVWIDEAEAISDGEGGYIREKPCYVLYRPGSVSKGMWNTFLRSFKKG
jgi:hypothetical protein